MKFGALPSAYYLRPAYGVIDDAAEVAWTRSVAVAAAAETSGVVSPAALPSLFRGTPTKARIAAVVDQLVGAGLWLPVDGGWEISRWDEDQTALEDIVALQRRRTADAARKRKSRGSSTKSGSNPDGNDPGPDPVDKPDTRTSAQVRRTRAPSNTTRSRDMSRDNPQPKGSRRRRRSTAAAAADRPPATLAAAEPAAQAAAAPGLTPDVATLRARLELAGLVVRWDTLAPSEVEEIEALIGAQSAPALVRAALASRAAHREPPAYARAWLSLWRALPPPGRTVALAPCPAPDCTNGWLPDEPDTGAPVACPHCRPHLRGATA